MSFLEMRNVSKTYGEGATEVHALSGIDLFVDAGALVAVMGPSGSGKSTLLTIAGSLEDPTSGEVVVGGATLSAMSRNDKARMRRRSIGFRVSGLQPAGRTECRRERRSAPGA